jgi:ABC-type multidrug transport system ATPase subunit
MTKSAIDSGQLQCRNLTKAYKGKRVLDNVSLSFNASKSLLDGPNGSGKSTLLRLLASIETVDGGEIFWQLKGVGNNGVDAIQANKPIISIASETVLPPDVLTAREVLSLVEKHADIDKPFRTKMILSLGFNDFLSTGVDELSSGSLKKLILISAMSKKCEVLLLDEPFANLDNSSREIIKQLILDDRRFMIIVDHHRLLTDLPTVSLSLAL